jgi:hypothetical protein
MAKATQAHHTSRIREASEAGLLLCEAKLFRLQSRAMHTLLSTPRIVHTHHQFDWAAAAVVVAAAVVAAAAAAGEVVCYGL